MKGIFIKGIEEKYPEKVLEGRLQHEGSVVSCLWKDPMLLDDTGLKKDNFITKDGRFYFSLAKMLRKKGINSLDEISILANTDERIQEEFEARGGYETIDNMTSCVDLINFDSYLDQLYRDNVLLRLVDIGLDIDKKVRWNNQIVQPLEIFSKMTAEQVVEFYDSLLADIDVGKQSSIDERTELDFSDEWLNSLAEGEEYGIPFDYAFEDVDGQPIPCFPKLSNRTAGLMSGYVHMFGGYSSVGKSTILIPIIISLLSSGHKVLIFSNEEKANKYKTKIISWILAQYCHCNTITKGALTRGQFDKNDPNIQIAMSWWNDKCKANLVFIRTKDADTATVIREARKYVLDYGFDVVVYDTFKIQSGDMKNNRQDLALIRDVRTLDDFAKKYDVCVLATVQLSEATKGKLWLDASTLSNSKQIKEQLENLFLMRNVADEELDSNSKYYIRPFKRVKEGGCWVEQELTLDKSKSWVVLFLEKSRSGANSSNTNTAYLLLFDGDHSLFEEYCLCRPRRTTLS